MADASSTPSDSPADRADGEAWSGVHRGPLAEPGSGCGSPTPRGAGTTSASSPGKRFFTNKGHLDHDELIGRDEGFSVTSSAGGEYLVFRPLLSEFVVSMPRGAAVVYPKDAAQIVAMADVFPGARVVEAGVGSGALTCSLLRAVGPHGSVSSYERRQEFADVAERNVDAVLRRAAPGLAAHRRRPRRGDGRGGRQRRPGRARHARALGVRRPGRARRWRRAGSSAPTSRRRPSSARPSRPCAPTAGSPSRSRGRPWCATGTSRASPSGPGTR